MQQLHSLDYSSESVDLSQVSGLTDGMYRMGVWVNSDNGVSNPPDDPNDNAGLIQSSAGTSAGSVINYTSATGIAKLANINEQVSVYPNPANNSFQIAFTGNKQATVNVYDINGNMVLSQSIQGKTII